MEEDKLILTIIKIVAYITPFFLIPATFKFGMGVFGNLSGMVNDRSRGLFDRQKKYRANTRAQEFAKAKAGERFNNRGLNALTSHGTTRNFGYGRKGRAAYQQKIAGAGVDFGKSAQGQATQHNDDALAAMTYGSAIEAQSMLTKKVSEGGFGFDKARAKNAIAAAKAAGGFGRDRQVWAAQQLAATGTGYENLEQVSKTIARASHGNTGQAAALAGNINATTKAVGRSDLAPGFGKLNALANTEMTESATFKDPETGVVMDMRQAYHTAHLAATGSQDAMTLMRQKTPGVKNILQTLKTEVVENPSNQAARSTVNDLINAMSYGPQPNQQELITLFSDHPDYKDRIETALTAQRQGRVGLGDRNAEDILNPPPPPE